MYRWYSRYIEITIQRSNFYTESFSLVDGYLESLRFSSDSGALYNSYRYKLPLLCKPQSTQVSRRRRYKVVDRRVLVDSSRTVRRLKFHSIETRRESTSGNFQKRKSTWIAVCSIVRLNFNSTVVEACTRFYDFNFLKTRNGRVVAHFLNVVRYVYLDTNFLGSFTIRCESRRIVRACTRDAGATWYREDACR